MPTLGTKISELTAATSLDGTELVPVVQGGVSKQATVSLFIGGPACIVDGGVSPAYLAGSGFTGGITHNGTGDVTLTLAAEYAIGTLVPVVCTMAASASIATVEIASTTTLRVRTFDHAGVAADVDFSLVSRVVAD